MLHEAPGKVLSRKLRVGCRCADISAIEMHDPTLDQLQTPRFPPENIAHVVWLYVRFNLSLREVDEMMLERGIDVSYETIRRWTRKFGSLNARNLCR